MTDWKAKYERLKRRTDRSHELFVEFMRLTLDYLAKAEPMLEAMKKSVKGKSPRRT